MNKNELQQIEKRIAQLGLKKKYIAERIDIKPSQLSHYLSAKRETPEHIKSKLLNLLGL